CSSDLRWLERGAARERDSLAGELRSWQASHGYDQAVLLNAAGDAVLVESKATCDCAVVRPAAMEAMRTRRMVFVDLHRPGADVGIHLGYVAPLIDAAGKVLGALYLGWPAERFLYPYLADWPLPTHSGETLLVRQDGADVLYLNEVKHRPGSALVFRLPGERADLPAARAVFWKETRIVGSNYRGRGVLAVAQGIPDTPWTMIAELDSSDILAQITRLAVVTGAAALMVFALAVAVVISIWQKAQLQATLAEAALVQSLRKSEARGRLALDIALLGIWRHELSTDLMYLDERTREHFGCDRKELPLQDGLASVHPDDRHGLQQSIASMLSNRSEDSRLVEFRTVDADGRLRHVETVAQIHFEGEGSSRRPSHVFGISRDITAQRTAEEALRRSEEKHRTLFQTMTQGVVYQASGGAVVDANPAAARMVGLTIEQMRNFASLDLYWHAIREDGSGFREEEYPAMVALHTGRAVRNVTMGIICGSLEAGVRWVNVSSTPLFASGAAIPDLVYSTLEDVTERKCAADDLERSRAELRALNAQVQSVREAERGRIAREIHDELGQALTALKMDLVWMKKRLVAGQEPLTQKVEEMVATIHDTVAAVRRISQELRPSILDTLGVVEAVEWLVCEFRKRMGIRCNTRLQRTAFDLPDDMKTHVFRICQELLTNVARHAEANRVDVALECSDGVLVLSVMDNGKGMGPARAGDFSLGLLGMRERAGQMGGSVEVQTVPAIAGTRVTVRIPMPRVETEIAAHGPVR
ncbi:MAG: PAS domain S-box protein, partial [Zoogloea sp.]|nr:PAS domain S-box protein [Zoogloea sp.]